MRRVWINAPSTSNSLHKYHGIDVLAEEPLKVYDRYDRKPTRIYFLSGTIISMVVHGIYLADGWKSSY